MEAVQRREDTLGKQPLAPARFSAHGGAQLFVTIKGFFRNNAFAGLHADKVLFQELPLPAHLKKFIGENDEAPRAKDDLHHGLGIFDDQINGSFFGHL